MVCVYREYHCQLLAVMKQINVARHGVSAKAAERQKEKKTHSAATAVVQR